ncbi:MAG TPA: acyl-CoA dehydrogenase family protein [Isosphaeraceae bacterium]|nr:acyl-CoA dehydrogenase family protein [Isosphaeraceae bacterium]
MSTQTREPETQTFVEAALKLGGKSEEEARTTGTVDRADDQVDALFAARYQTANSPAHRIVWDREATLDLFLPQPPATSPASEKIMQRSLEAVRKNREQGSLYGPDGKVSEAVLNDLSQAGYWGLLIAPEYGGGGASFASFARFLTKMATIEPNLAGLASVHGCIGAVDPLRTFGNSEQKERYLPRLASGERLSAFALTEPGAGSDLTALKTQAVLDGDDYVVNGEKLFITNAVPGRTIGLVCLIDKRPAVLIVDLPDHEDEHFQLVTYGLLALRHLNNHGLRFRDFRVPRENLLQPAQGDGLTIAYHGLNLGRVALCATAAGSMRVMLANMLPWAKFRRTYGAAIVSRELVERRIGRMAALIVGCDAMVDWCSWLLDQGFRGELECIIAKIFGSESQKEAAVELFMKTHGGRAFLKGHLFGDNIHEYLAPCIYEGEGEMLGMAFFKSLIKEHGKEFFEPIGRAIQASGIKKPNPMNPAHAWALRSALVPYAKWRTAQMVTGKRRLNFDSLSLPPALAAHAEYAAEALENGRLEISDVMTKHQLRLADRQCRMAELSQRLQDLVVILATSLWASRQSNEVVQSAADILCQDLTRKITCKRPTDAYFRAVTKLGETVANGGFEAIAGIEAGEILMPYNA